MAFGLCSSHWYDAPPIGTIDLFLGFDHMSLHPVDLEHIGNLRLQFS